MFSSIPWILCCTFLLLLAAVAPLLAKAGIRHADADAAAAWRSFLLLLFLLLLQSSADFSIIGELSAVSGFKQWLFLCLGVAMAGGAWLLYNAALKVGTVVRTVGLLFLLPLPLLLLSLWLFPETRFSPFTPAGVMKLLAILLFLFAAVLLCIHENGKWIRSGLLALFLTAGALICFRYTPLSIGAGSIPLCIFLFALLSWLSLLFRGNRHAAFDIRLRDFLLLLFSALATAFAVLFYHLAVRKGSEEITMLFLGLSLLLLFPLAFLFLKERPAKGEVAAVLLLAGAMLLRTLPSIL